MCIYSSDRAPQWLCTIVYWKQSCHSQKISKFSDFFTKSKPINLSITCMPYTQFKLMFKVRVIFGSDKHADKENSEDFHWEQ